MRYRNWIVSSFSHALIAVCLVLVGVTGICAEPTGTPATEATATPAPTPKASETPARNGGGVSKISMQAIRRFISDNRVPILILAVLLVAYSIWLFRAWYRYGPRDTVGNGITIGDAKAFDNRSLALRIERLGDSLKALKVVNQNVTDNLSTIQKQTSSQSNQSLTLEVKTGIGKGGKETSEVKEGGKEVKADTASSEAAKGESKPVVALAASDILSDQLNLASQILNLETLYERSLSDRLIDDGSRLQTVLGFQVSITPPSGLENCVAVTEVSVRLKDSDHAVSLVALIPQEKTYNAQTVSSSSKSMGGSAVASVLTLGFSSKGESRQLFIHRDSDTIAFERDPRSQPKLFDSGKPTVFGWEFRPVLGRSSVSAGTRQMLAVMAVPIADKPQASNAAKPVILEIRTRSYWRRYHQKKQTSRGNWGLIPWRVDRSMTLDSAVQELVVPNTAQIQKALAPKVTDIKWVNSGGDRATVIVEGANFFSGTKVVTGGTVRGEGDGNLILKSDQALEFETSIASLATGDSVLSGRFGSSLQLTVPPDRRPVASLEIINVEIVASGFTKASRITIDVKGLDALGDDQDLTVEQIQKLPEPILFIGSEPVAMPYDYYDEPTAREPEPEGKAAGTETTPDAGTSAGPSPQPPKNHIRVAAWIPKALAKSPSVAFRVPFCGFEYQASMPLSSSEEPTITRMGGDKDQSVFRIAHPLGFSRSSYLVVELDRQYSEIDTELRRTSDFDYRFTVPTPLVLQYQSLVVRMGSLEPHLLSIPMEAKPKPKPAIDMSGKPPQIAKSNLGPIEWSGTALDAIADATLKADRPATAGQPAGTVSTPAQFAIYDGGKRIEVVFKDGSTEVPGKAEVELKTTAGDFIRLPLFITKEAAAAPL